MTEQPTLFTGGNYSSKDIEDFQKKHQNLQVHDIYEQQLKEVFEILNPSQQVDEQHLKNKLGKDKGSWVFLPWSKEFLHIVNEQDLFTLRTNRNQYLITKEEQLKLQKYTIGIVGLSVGNSIALSLAYSGIGGKFILADNDSFSTSNINRVHIRLSDIGRPKLTVTIRQMYEANPYAQVEAIEKGLTEINLAKFFTGGKQIVFDEIDDFEMKVRIRQEAKKHKVPVVMLTNLGDNVLIDIERYDTEPDTELFNGLADEAIREILKGSNTEKDKKRFAAQIVGIENVPTRALSSLRDIGSHLVGRPQLYGTVSIAGGLAAYIVRQIALGKDMPSGRFLMSSADVFNSPKKDLELSEERRQILNQLRRQAE